MMAHEAMDHARSWLDGNSPYRHTHLSDKQVACMVELSYPTGMAGFVEDMAQAHSVS